MRFLTLATTVCGTLAASMAGAEVFMNDNVVVRQDFQETENSLLLGGEVFPNVATGSASIGEFGAALLEGSGTISLTAGQPGAGNAALFEADGFTYLAYDAASFGNIAGPTGMTASMYFINQTPGGDGGRFLAPAPAWIFSGNPNTAVGASDDFGVRIQSGGTEYRAVADGGSFFGGGAANVAQPVDHVAYVVRPAGSQYRGELWVNGVFRAQSTLEPGFDSLEAAFIGAWARNGFEWRLDNEIIDDFRLYNVALSADEIATLAKDRGLAGDHNGDGVVNAADYTVYRDSEGQAAGALFNDITGGVIGAGQLATWFSNFGAVGPEAVSSTPVPEPSAVAILTLATLGCGCRGRRRL